MTALGSRLEFMRQLMENYRDRVANDTQKEQRDAVRTIEAYLLRQFICTTRPKNRGKFSLNPCPLKDLDDI